MTEIFTNATVTTMDEERPEAEAFAVSDGVFTFVGTGEEAREYARRLESEGKSVTLTDLAGKSVLPAFQDSHMHFVGFAKHFINVDLNGCASIQEVQQRLRDRLERSGTDGPEEDAWAVLQSGDWYALVKLERRAGLLWSVLSTHPIPPINVEDTGLYTDFARP